MDFREQITINASRRRGKPCIRNLRTTVYDVLEYLDGGMDDHAILEAFPELGIDDIEACRSFAALTATRFRANDTA